MTILEARARIYDIFDKTSGASCTHREGEMRLSIGDEVSQDHWLPLTAPTGLEAFSFVFTSWTAYQNTFLSRLSADPRRRRAADTG